MALKQHEIPFQQCPKCAAPVNIVYAQPGDRAPQPGDPSICRHCGALRIYGHGLMLRFPTEEEKAQLPMDEIDALSARIIAELAAADKHN